MKNKQRYVLCIFIIILFSVTGCQTLTLFGKTGLFIENRSSSDIRIESLKKITFEDRKATLRKRSYRYYIHKIDTVLIRPGLSKRFNIEDGYYGIEFCDGEICSYINFRFEKAKLLIVEDVSGKNRTTYRFVK